MSDNSELKHPLAGLARASGPVQLRGVMRQQVEDFQVHEQFNFGLDGEGEHAWIQIRKTGLTTPMVADRLADLAGVRQRDIGWSGLKDRQGVTTQWLSVHLPGQPDPDWLSLQSDELQILAAVRHGRKLKRGTHVANQFNLVIRNLQGDTADLDARLQSMAQRGFPNYFGEQRFGRDGDNVDQALEMFRTGKGPRNRTVRGLLLSAARSFLFNKIVSARIENGTWLTGMSGDALLPGYSRRWFVPEEFDQDIHDRLASGDLHVSGPLWGKGELPVQDAAAALEQALSESDAELCRGLEKAGMKQERRALRVMPSELNWQLDGDCLTLQFALPRGCYATALVRELVDYSPTG